MAKIIRLSSRLAAKRDLRGVREVAAEIGISPATVSRVERGHSPDLETFAKICRWLDVDPGEVLGFTNRRKVNMTKEEISASLNHIEEIFNEVERRLIQVTALKDELHKLLNETSLAWEFVDRNDVVIRGRRVYVGYFSDDPCPRSYVGPTVLAAVLEAMEKEKPKA